MNILIISYHFPPVMNVGGMRALSWAKYWSEMGHNITVIAADSQHQSENRTAKIEASVPENIKLYYVDTLQKINKSNDVQETEQKNSLAGIVSFMKSNVPIADLDIKFIEDSKRIIRGLKKNNQTFDYVVSTASPLADHIIGLYAKQILKCKFIADYRDLVEQSNDKPNIGIIREKAINKVEKKVLKNADILTTVSEELNNILKTKKNKIKSIGQNYCIFNGYFHELIDSAKVEPCDVKWQIVYTGTYYENQFEIDALLEALSQVEVENKIPVPELIFIGEGRRNVQSEIKILANNYGLSTVTFVQAMPLEQVLKVQMESAMLLLLDGIKNKGVLKTKSYEYLAARRPIIAIVNPEGELANKFLNGYKGYVVGNNVQKIKNFIENMYELYINQENPEHMYIDNSSIEYYSRKNQAMRLLEYMQIENK